MKKKEPLTKEAKEAKNLARNLKKMEEKRALEEKKAKKRKQKSYKRDWSEEDINRYLNKSKSLSDFTCKKSGIVESKYSKKPQRKRK